MEAGARFDAATFDAEGAEELRTIDAIKRQIVEIVAEHTEDSMVIGLSRDLAESFAKDFFSRAQSEGMEWKTIDIRRTALGVLKRRAVAINQIKEKFLRESVPWFTRVFLRKRIRAEMIALTRLAEIAAKAEDRKKAGPASTGPASSSRA